MTTIPEKSPRPPTSLSVPLDSLPTSLEAVASLAPETMVVEPSSPLEQAIAHYRETIVTLQTTDAPSAEQLLDARIARDAIHDREIGAPEPLPPPQRREIKQIDRDFKQAIRRFKIAYKKQVLKQASPHPAAKWWWFPEPSVPKPFWAHLDSVWSASSLLFLTFSGGLVVELAARLLSGGLDAWGSSTVIIQSLAALLVGKSALTTSGQETVKQWLGQRGFPRQWWDEGSLLVSIGLFVSLLSFQSLALPEFAKFYKCFGDAASVAVDGWSTCLPGGDRSPLDNQPLTTTEIITARLSSAENMYKRALSLNPDYADAHLALGRLYEALQDFKQAQDAYEKAVKGGKLEGYNALAQLALKQETPNYEKAVGWLSKGLTETYHKKTDQRFLLYEMADTLTNLAVSTTAGAKKGNSTDKGGKYLDDAVFWVSRGLDSLQETPDVYWQYRLNRNLGWLLLRQGEHDRALDHLQIAIELSPNRPDAYCLWAQVNQQQLSQVRQRQAIAEIKPLQQNIVENWERCRTLASPYDQSGKVNTDELNWQREATKQLKKYSSSQLSQPSVPQISSGSEPLPVIAMAQPIPAK
jgi:tetratricopeptide (TPR) repeat protein